MVLSFRFVSWMMETTDARGLGGSSSSMNRDYDRRRERGAMARGAQICRSTQNLLRDRQNIEIAPFRVMLPAHPQKFLTEGEEVY